MFVNHLFLLLEINVFHSLQSKILPPFDSVSTMETILGSEKRSLSVKHTFIQKGTAKFRNIESTEKQDKARPTSKAS